MESDGPQVSNLTAAGSGLFGSQSPGLAMALGKKGLEHSADLGSSIHMWLDTTRKLKEYRWNSAVENDDGEWYADSTSIRIPSYDPQELNG